MSMSHSERLAELRRLIQRAGLTFADCVTVFACPDDDEEGQALIQAARRLQRDGEIEFDDNVVLSGSGDDGDYVLAWVWISNEEAGLPNADDEDEETIDIVDDDAFTDLGGGDGPLIGMSPSDLPSGGQRPPSDDGPIRDGTQGGSAMTGRG